MVRSVLQLAFSVITLPQERKARFSIFYLEMNQMIARLQNSTVGSLQRHPSGILNKVHAGVLGSD